MNEANNVLTIKTVQIQPIRNMITAIKDVLTDATITFTNDDGCVIINCSRQIYIFCEQMDLLINRFKPKEDKYFADLVNDTQTQSGEVVFGRSSSGVKGFFGEVKMEVTNANNAKKELFAVSSDYELLTN